MSIARLGRHAAPRPLSALAKDLGGVGVGAEQSAGGISRLLFLARAIFRHLERLPRILGAAILVRCRCAGVLGNKVTMGKPASGPSEIPDPPEAHLGPAMLALNVSQRRFVLAAVTFPIAKDWQLAKAAGYSDRSYGSLRVAAHRLLHDEQVIAAIAEETGKRLRGQGALVGIGIMFRIAQTDGHKDQLRAAEALAGRAGFHEVSEHKLQVEHTDKRGAALIERIRALAGALGVDARALIGVNAAPQPPVKLIEGEAVDVPHDP